MGWQASKQRNIQAQKHIGLGDALLDRGSQKYKLTWLGLDIH